MTEDRTKKERQAKYKESRARLDLMLLPEVLERFKNLQGLEGKAHPERLVALMDCWDDRHSQKRQEEKPSVKAAQKRQPAGRKPAISKADLEPMLKSLDSHDVQLAIIQSNSFELHRQLWPGRQKAPAAWAEAMKAADAQAALARVKTLSGPLCDLMKAGCLSISADEVIALGKLPDEYFPVMVAQLSETGKFKGHAENDAEIHFEMLLSGVSV